MKVSLFHTRLHARLLRPGFSALGPEKTSTLPNPLRAAVQRIDVEIQRDARKSTSAMLWSLRKSFTLLRPARGMGAARARGGEFLNWHLVNYFARRRCPVSFTRSRAYRKNDNARVEQKNWTHVRQLVGYGRLEDPRAAELLNELYAKE